MQIGFYEDTLNVYKIIGLPFPEATEDDRGFAAKLMVMLCALHRE